MNAVIKVLNQRFYVKELLLLVMTYLLMEGLFSWLLVRDSGIIENYRKIAAILVYAFMLFNFSRLKRSERVYLVIFSLVMVRLVFESLALYDSLFRQFTMFMVLFPVIFAFFIRHLLRSMETGLLEFIAKFYLVTYIIFMLLFGRGFSFSLESVEMSDYGPFSGDTRIIHASHIFMMIIPLLWYLNRFITTGKASAGLIFIFCTAVIVVHQHRSVWSSALAALFFYTLACTRNGIIKLRGTFNLVFITGVAAVVAWLFISSLYPGFIDFLDQRFAEIFNPSKEGSTGNFRIQQREVYSALYLERPVFGWTFQGFEMANPLVDWWPENTGQHFHEGYIEVLFYHGAVGLLLKYSILLYLLAKAFSKKLSAEAVILVAFSVSGLVFSLNYILPLIFWGHAGMCLYYLEKRP
ncbi:MAG TPA: O-antigen ligase family protein [Chitinophagaceae bacterium]|nr:O-antigen ligase family protein [Chitinophagaceae bacterium]